MEGWFGCPQRLEGQGRPNVILTGVSWSVKAPISKDPFPLTQPSEALPCLPTYSAYSVRFAGLSMGSLSFPG